MQIYVASSPENRDHEDVVKTLSDAGYFVWNYRDPANGIGNFSFKPLTPKEGWTAEGFENVIRSKDVSKAFWIDMNGLASADVLVALFPLDVSSSIKIGFAMGRRIPVIVVYDAIPKPELMIKMTPFRCVRKDELLQKVLEVKEISRHK